VSHIDVACVDVWISLVAFRRADVVRRGRHYTASDKERLQKPKDFITRRIAFQNGSFDRSGCSFRGACCTMGVQARTIDCGRGCVVDAAMRTSAL